MKTLRTIVGFIILFLLYHAAEYMILFRNSPMGFLGFQLVFFIAAWAIAKWQTGKGLSAWGLDGKRFLFKHLVAGMLMGIVLYGVTFLLSIGLGLEKITSVPSFSAALMPMSLFVFGNFFSSFSEDVLTRGYVYHHLNKRVSTIAIIFISAAIYLINHIYRLKDGPQAWSYLFMLGVLYVMPLILTKRLWFTGGMHWAGNCTFYFTHEVMKTDNVPNKISPNYILLTCTIVFVPFIYLLIKRLNLTSTLDTLQMKREEKMLTV